MPSFLSRLVSLIRIWSLKAAVSALLIVWRAVEPPSAHCAPTLVKTYHVRPKLRNRIHIPRAYESHRAPLPLYLNIHGGGWTLMEALDDDEFCSYIANTFNVVVVNIDYHKAPRNPFPGPINDVVAIAGAAIADEELPIDRRRIAMGGFSAGGNLALAASQRAELHDVIQAVVSFFAPLDMATPVSRKLETRLRPDKPDMLAGILGIFNEAYMTPGTNPTNPLLSPIYAKRDALAAWLCVIGAEEDCLCLESRDFAEKMALSPDNEGKSESDTWERGKVKWELMRGMAHNFTHLRKRAPSAEIRRKEANVALYGRIFAWLHSGPWS
ncbi:hypothetical protein JX265_005066 [Neoarthrinium moseri]|uniref:Alpha/beta hydrolase fold-3 domain-containing protein n=1 Tax=Neoarthrinium moseri TaxID=1658444 RepID=A0A9Q0AS27_9PEZI|nr:hypothetical protein JX266_011060 [Neoarthrinium moseri]KAI1873444.1 hypothetical protein JX265_005066 [Neoarthrinium moseri]